MAVFDPTTLTPDDIIALMVEFFSRVLFHDIINDAAEAWNKTDDPARTVQAENELLDLVRATVDRHLSPLLADGLGQMSREQIEVLERKALDDVWAEWSSYE